MFPYSGKILQETWKNILLYKDFKSDFESVRTVNFLICYNISRFNSYNKLETILYWISVKKFKEKWRWKHVFQSNTKFTFFIFITYISHVIIQIGLVFDSLYGAIEYYLKKWEERFGEKPYPYGMFIFLYLSTCQRGFA